MIPPDKDWIDLLQALLTPVIGGFGIYIAIQQHSINKKRFKFELYDKRYDVYQKIAAFIAEILTSGRVEPGADINFLRDTKTVGFLFNSEAKEYTEEIYKKVVDLDTLQKTEKSSDSDRLGKNLDKQTEIKMWFKDELAGLENRFAKYLRIEC